MSTLHSKEDLTITLEYVGGNPTQQIFKLPDGNMLILPVEIVRNLRMDHAQVWDTPPITGEVVVQWLANYFGASANATTPDRGVDPSSPASADPQQGVSAAPDRLEPLAPTSARLPPLQRAATPTQPQRAPLEGAEPTPQDPSGDGPDRGALERMGISFDMSMPTTHTVNDPSSVDGSVLTPDRLQALVDGWEAGTINLKAQIVDRFLVTPWNQLLMNKHSFSAALRKELVMKAASTLPGSDRSGFLPASLAEMVSEELDPDSQESVKLQMLGQDKLFKEIDKPFVGSDRDEALLHQHTPKPSLNTQASLTAMLSQRLGIKK